ncbi:MAG: hypothetical protein HYT49_00730 [Candidatus Wildermuthbacteria bacterium]|nr:hypothetical protein [Candidatus Wildermuthbacteria bacterium]
MSAENSGTEWAPEELEMACLAAVGLSNSDIGHMFGRSEQTVKGRVDGVLAGVGLATKRELARLIIQRGENGNLVLDPRFANELTRSTREFVKEVLDELSKKALLAKRLLFDREVEVLKLLRRGAGNKEIASCLGIEESTVKAHVSGLIRKMGVENRYQASLVGDAMGLGP